MARDPDGTVSHVLPAPLADDRRRVWVFWSGGQKIVELPQAGSLTVGRALDCDICVDHPSVSRRHLVVHCDAVDVSVEDFGSSNGIRFRGMRPEKKQRLSIGAGDAVEFGAAVLVLQRTGRTFASPTIPPSGEASDAMERLRSLLDVVARSNVDIILMGETGVGKDVAATTVHQRSVRREHPFVRLNCAALPEALAEAELFGYERGAFTGAEQAKPGLLEVADKGTLLLDEVGELSPAMQAKLLRAVETREVQRVGSLKPRPVDLRFIAATNCDLEAAVRAGSFRQDLYFRLNGITLRIPPLRDRLREIPGLAATFVAEACEAAGRPAATVSARALEVLLAHRWPGNVRELRKVTERAVLVCDGGTVDEEHIMIDKLHDPQDDDAAPPTPAASADLREELRAVQRQRVLEALERSGGHQGKAAELLNVSRRTLLNWLDTFDLPRPRKDSRRGR